ncbi:DUF2301 domain-containing membrane protein [Vibrio amylolyticus]|uniref:DUF2301 domain-containing membrane protein n=1 Tax=Vibrio amylolyticus TaxID=2847292 RepID=UPI00354B5DB9
MANPEHIEVLDTLDKASVVAYRLGIVMFSIASVWYCLIGIVELSWGELPLGFHFDPSILFCIATALSAANLHVYDKKIRSIIMYSGWLSIVLFVALAESEATWIAYGFVFVAFSGIALKESFCFNVFGLKLVPLLLMAVTFSMAFTYWLVVYGLLAVVAIIFVYLSIRKSRMPLHFDVGNKSNYQI